MGLDSVLLTQNLMKTEPHFSEHLMQLQHASYNMSFVK